MAQIDFLGSVPTDSAPGAGGGSGSVNGQDIAPKSVQTLTVLVPDDASTLTFRRASDNATLGTLDGIGRWTAVGGLTTSTIRSPAGGNLDMTNTGVLLLGQTNLYNGGLRLYGSAAQMVVAFQDQAGISSPAPGVVAAGNGTPGDASGTVQAARLSAPTAGGVGGTGTLRLEADFGSGKRIQLGPLGGDIYSPADSVLTVRYGNVDVAGNFTASGTVASGNGYFVAQSGADAHLLASNGNVLLQPGGSTVLTASPGQVAITGNLIASGTVQTGVVQGTVATGGLTLRGSADNAYNLNVTSGVAVYGNFAAYSNASVNGNLTVNGPIKPGSYTVATLPSASGNDGAIATVTDSTKNQNQGRDSAVQGGGNIKVSVHALDGTWYVS